MTYAAVQDVAVAIGRPMSDADEDAQVTQWLYDVEMLLVARIGDLSFKDAEVVTYVEREAVAELIRRKDARNSEADSATSVFLDYLGPWWALLDIGDTSRAGAYTFRPQFTPDLRRSTSWDWSANGLGPSH